MTHDEKNRLLKARLKHFNQTLTGEQLDFIMHPITEPCYLKACPGSGKTEVVGIKAAYEICNWRDNFSGLAVLSFTKTSAREIANRVKRFGGTNATQHPHFIGTIDSWLHGYVLHPFAHKSSYYKGLNSDKSYQLVDNDERYDFLNPFKTVISPQPNYKDVWVNEYYFECADPPALQSQDRTLDVARLSATAKSALQKNKRQFLEAGLATYADAEFLCYYFLSKNKKTLKSLVRRFPILMIDECQDLSNNQLEILKLLSQSGSTIHFIGDINQSIYEFKKVYVEKIAAFVTENKLVERLLSENFRSNQSIVNVTLALERYNTGKTPGITIGHEKSIANKSCLLWEYMPNDFPKLPQRFIDHVYGINSIIPFGETRIDIAKCGILARGHSTLAEFRSHPMSELSKVELFANALSCWSNDPRTGKDMQNSLRQLGKAVCLLAFNGQGNHQHQYCPKGYNQIEWRNLLCDLIVRMSRTSGGMYPFNDDTWSKWASHLKLFLREYWDNIQLPCNNWDSIKAKIKSPTGRADSLVIDTIRNNNIAYSEKIRMTTIHDVKGETLDAVLVVSSKDKKSKGGHFQHWLSDKIDEKEFVRFAYVASSRPKHLLVWAIPKTQRNPIVDKIIDLGFQKE